MSRISAEYTSNDVRPARLPPLSLSLSLRPRDEKILRKILVKNYHVFFSAGQAMSSGGYSFVPRYYLYIILSHPADNENSFREVTMRLYDTLVDTRGIAERARRTRSVRPRSVAGENSRAEISRARNPLRETPHTRRPMCNDARERSNNGSAARENEFESVLTSVRCCNLLFNSYSL